MLLWFLIGYFLFVATLVGYSAYVAISCPDAKRRADAFKVLKLIWVTGTGAGGVTLAITSAMLKMRELGII
ncbi:hypothetical protein ACFXHA_43265 [Nocardia sp. NPDC059240]|uniref:hypothetical protein n=1 Tax=Nocardia sp. NPDC059240 TaxID=3346786 RepID=UPI00368C9B1E